MGAGTQWQAVCHPLGDGAVTLEPAGDPPPGWNSKLRAFAAAVERIGFPGLVEAAAGIRTVTVYYDPAELYRGLEALERREPDLRQAGIHSLQDVLSSLLKLIWERMETEEGESGRLVEIPVAYGGVYGPDLEDTARICGMSPEEVVELHCKAEYHVLMLGFMPGFPYLDGLPPELRTERLAAPRLRVPAGSVAIGGGQTGIYPLEAPGGWRIIGRTPLALFRPGAQEPFMLAAGDRVRFVNWEAGRLLQEADWPKGAENSGSRDATGAV